MGSGDINDTVNLPAGGSFTYTVIATISPSATGTLSNTATITGDNLSGCTRQVGSAVADRRQGPRTRRECEQARLRLQLHR